MKKIFTAILLTFSLSSFAQIDINSQWTWVKGDSIINVAATYGTQGTAAPINQPGARFLSLSGRMLPPIFGFLGGVALLHPAAVLIF